MMQQRRRPPVALSPVALNNNSNRPIRQTTRSMSATASQCFGCSQPMHNPFISNVLDHLWHPECVRCFVCQCLLNEQCYSREGKLYCKDDFIKKYIHRCFACQNLVQSHELIRRIRAGRIYHADCFVCSKCRRTLQDDDISSILKSDSTTLNDLECVCQTCLNPGTSSDETTSLSNAHENKTKDNDISKTMNGKMSPLADTQEEKPLIPSIDIPPTTNGTSAAMNHVDEQQSMEVDEPPPDVKASVSPVKEPPPPSSPPMTTTKAAGRQSKVRQSTSSNGSKRSPTKAKATTPVSRQKQTAAAGRKGRSPATRSKSSAGTSATPPTSSAVRTRSSNRRTAKTTRYRKRSFSSGSDEEETEDDDDEEENDSDFSDEDNMPTNEQEMNHSSAVKTKPVENSHDKKTEPEPALAIAQPPLPPPPSTSTSTLPLQTATNPSLLSQAKMSEPLSLLSGLAANPMSISSIMKPDIAASFMPPNFNPAFPPHSHFLPPGYSLPPRLPMPLPPSLSTSQSASASDANRSANASDTDSLDRSSSPSQMDVSTNVEPGTPARPVTPPKNTRQATPSTSTHKPSALSSLLEFGTLPPSTLGDLRSSSSSTNPFPFPFVTPGPGALFSPQAAAGMATFYRPPFGVPPTAMPLDMSQSNSNASKKKSDTIKTDEIVSQNLLDDSSSGSPKKKARKSNGRSKAKSKKTDTDGENGVDEENTLSPPPPPPSSSSSAKKKKKKKLTSDATENGNTNDSDETKVTNGNAHNLQHNLLAQMGLMNNSFMPHPPPSASTTNGQTSAPNSQQAQLAAMYNMAPHFAAYNAFQGAFNPAFAAAAYGSGYPTPYGFHPAFGATPGGQPFPFMPPTPTTAAPPTNNASTTEEKTSTIIVPETRPAKSRSKSNTGGEKKKTATPRSNKKKTAAAAPIIATDLSVPTDSEPMLTVPSIEITPQVATTPESTSTPTKRQMSSTSSEDFDEQHQLHTTNGKSGNESDGSMGDGDRSLNSAPSMFSSMAPEKKGARTTIKPQQLDLLCKAYDDCSKPNKAQREQLVAETGLTLRVIQVWFQNKRSKERKGKNPKEKGASLDDDDAGDDSQPSSPLPAPAESIPVTNTES